ncbi:DUF1294 domain-containing protein [Paenibacillus nasutitermitis]|uniref:DUF1294 domain-containing protein n=1 Tax=Paenibacillus nasutitermitis TaxID=1652958 RepID=A0A916YYT8_9BACL|nr:DUF1294 domain-containing protein [Paenibacillus nasutitermitis]GGD67517.1 hypothetical protein GCM10010911_26620 [Paenibacillus nasutitermitis]
MKLLIVYLLVMNVTLLILMRIDKTRSGSASGRRHRIPERRLLGVGALGGALGGWIAMRMFRHKTKHAAFAAGFPVMVLIHAVVLIAAYRYLA